jgi:hypothetical protein
MTETKTQETTEKEVYLWGDEWEPVRIESKLAAIVDAGPRWPRFPLAVDTLNGTGFSFSIGHKIVETMAIETDLKEGKSCKSKEVLASTCC